MVQEPESGDGLSRWILALVGLWLDGARVWHFEEVQGEACTLLSRRAVGVWFVLADTVSIGCTRGLLISYHGDDHLEINAFVAWRMGSRSELRAMGCFSEILDDLVARGDHCVAPQEIQYCVPVPAVLALWAILFGRYRKNAE